MNNKHNTDIHQSPIDPAVVERELANDYPWPGSTEEAEMREAFLRTHVEEAKVKIEMLIRQAVVSPVMKMNNIDSANRIIEDLYKFLKKN